MLGNRLKSLIATILAAASLATAEGREEEAGAIPAESASAQTQPSADTAAVVQADAAVPIDTVVPAAALADPAVPADTVAHTVSVASAAVSTPESTMSSGAATPVVSVEPTGAPVADTVPGVLAGSAETASATQAESTVAPPADGAFLSAEESKFSQWLADNVFYILFFGASIAVIGVTLYFYSKKRRDTRRYLTTMRLSVLDRTVQKACRYIESRFTDPDLAVSDVCRELVTGEAYLDAMFVKEVGINVRDFITQVRVNGIKFFLSENPSRDIWKVCVQCGFPDRAAAEKHFARLCGVGMDEFVRSLK